MKHKEVRIVRGDITQRARSSWINMRDQYDDQVSTQSLEDMDQRGQKFTVLCQ